MKTNKTNIKNGIQSIFEMNNITKRNSWNNKRRYSNISQFRFV